jgi:dihydropyrimidine dehydrogenase (NADP+)
MAAHEQQDWEDLAKMCE